MTALTPTAALPVNIRDLATLIHAAAPACAADPDLFFGADIFEDETPAEHAYRVTAARKVCAACPVRLPCLAYALKTRPEVGVWGGLDADAGELAYLRHAAAWPANPPAGRWTRTPARTGSPEAAA